MYRAAKRDSNEKRIITYLKRCGASVVQLDDPSVPDLIFSWRGFSGLIEVKNKSGTLTKGQRLFIKNWTGHVFVVRSYHDAKLALRSLYMPTYTYKCTACYKELTVVQSFKDETLEVCEHCGGKLVRLIKTIPVVIYRGSGWAGKDTTSE